MKGHSKGEEIVQKIAEEAGVQSERFFLISSDVSRTRLAERLESIDDKVDGNWNFIVVAGDFSQIKMLNAMYGRKGVKFSSCSDTLWEQLVKTDKRFSMGLFLGAKRQPDESLLLYDGFDIPAPKRMEAVLEFIQN